MPTYEYECKKCRNLFSLVMSVGDHDKKKVRCPKCKSEETKHVVEPVFVTTARKS
jgi:putative FmdB family regulatory protein